MSFFGWRFALKVHADHSYPPWDGLIMAVARKASTNNLAKLIRCWPDILEEFITRYNAPLGALNEEEIRWVLKTDHNRDELRPEQLEAILKDIAKAKGKVAESTRAILTTAMQYPEPGETGLIALEELVGEATGIPRTEVAEITLDELAEPPASTLEEDMAVCEVLIKEIARRKVETEHGLT